MENSASEGKDLIPEQMTQLYLGMLKKGPAWTAQASEETSHRQREHLALLARLGRQGRLLLAGPVPEGEHMRGFVVCKADSLAAAEAYFAEDSHILSGRLHLEMYPWLVPKELLTIPLQKAS